MIFAFEGKCVLKGASADQDDDFRRDDGRADDHINPEDNLLEGVESREVHDIHSSTAHGRDAHIEGISKADGSSRGRSSPEDEGRKQPYCNETGVVQRDKVQF